MRKRDAIKNLKVGDSVVVDHLYPKNGWVIQSRWMEDGSADIKGNYPLYRLKHKETGEVIAHITYLGLQEVT